ncbi:MAG: diguanylate cyclase [Magnetococcales bacterium]|nr:diguanylate cyclase [Magnetococcales bacterium]
MQRRHVWLSALFIVLSVGLIATLWRLVLEETIDPLLFGLAHDASRVVENLEFISLSMIFVILALVPAGFFADRTLKQQEKAEEGLRIAAAVIKHASEGILITDADNRILSINPAFTVISGYNPDDVVGRTPAILTSGRHDSYFYAGMWEHIHVKGRWAGEIWNKRKNGEIYAQWLSIFTLTDEQKRVVRYVGFFSDITERKQREEKIAWQATHDSLTGLANRKHFLERLDKGVLTARLDGSALAVLFIDLDGFKSVNDTHGHEMGDLLLKHVAELLRQAVRREDLVARFGGDEFVILLRIASVEDAERVANKVIDLFAKPLSLATQELHVGSSIGVAVFPQDGGEGEALLRRADEGMYAAKRAGKNTWRR